MYLIIDTETNGLPDCKDIPYGFYPDYKLLDRYNKARIIQISYMLCNENIEEKELHDFVIKRENFTIDNGSVSRMYSTPIIFPEKTDIEVRAFSSSGSSCTSSFNLILIDNPTP